MVIYLDWNIFDRVEKLERLNEEDKKIYSRLYSILEEEHNYTPYSNAHLRDLFRGYKKKPEFIYGHLEILERVTKNLCICQYWNKKNVTLHYRSVSDFFEELKNEKESDIESIEDIIAVDSTGLLENAFNLLKNVPVPKEFKMIYREDPIFGVMYPLTRVEMTKYALTVDLLNLAFMMNTDYSLYKSLKKYISKARIKLKKHNKLIKLDKSNLKTKIETPKYLEIDSIIDNLPDTLKLKSENLLYRDIFNVFLRYDLKGYKTDNMFPNLIDDGLHTFYAAYGDVFITNDDRCHYKATKTYEKLKIPTKVYTAKEFIEEQESGVPPQKPDN